MIIQLSAALIAQKIENPALKALAGSSGAEFLSRFIPNFLTLVFAAGVVVFVIYLLIGGIGWITSGGDKAQAQQAKERVTQALIGLFLLLGFFAILNIIECFFGVSIRKITVGPFNITSVGSPVCPIGGGGGGGGGGVGNPNCPCSAAFGGGCASSGQIAIGPGSPTDPNPCYRCTAGGWDGPLSGVSCSPISCKTCP